MPVSLGANGGSYNYPQENDPAGWGDDATNWASAVSAALSNIGLGGTASTDAVVNIISTTKGVLIPRMTTTQRNAIGSPSTSLLIYNTTTTQYELYTGSTWQSLASYISGTLTVTGAASLQSTLNVTGASTFANVTINGDETVNGVLSVTGNTTLASVTGTNTTINGTLSVTGNTTLASVTGVNVTATGTILAASGTSGTPSISFSGDSNSGFYSISDNVIGVATNGTRVGQIGVGYGGFTGNIIQVVSAVKTDTATISSGSPSVFTDISGLSVNITPRYSNSRMLIKSMICYGSDNSTAIRGFFRFVRDSTAIGIGDTASNRIRASFVIEPFWTSYSITMGGMNFLDTVSSTNQITYKIQCCLSNISSTAYINRDFTYGDSAGYATGTSSIMIMEIQQ